MGGREREQERRKRNPSVEPPVLRLPVLSLPSSPPPLLLLLTKHRTAGPCSPSPGPTSSPSSRTRCSSPGPAAPRPARSASGRGRASRTIPRGPGSSRARHRCGPGYFLEGGGERGRERGGEGGREGGEREKEREKERRESECVSLFFSLCSENLERKQTEKPGGRFFLSLTGRDTRCCLMSSSTPASAFPPSVGVPPGSAARARSLSSSLK